MFEALIPPEWARRVIDLAPAEFWLGAGLLLALTLAAFYAIFHFLRRLRHIEGTPTSKIRSAAQGYVELDGVGRLLPGQPIRAPLTGVICTWYTFKVEERVETADHRGGRRQSWRTLRDGTSDDLFLLLDDTGECVIDPDGAEVIPAITEVWYGKTPEWSMGMAQPRNRFGVGARYRYTEKRMHPDDPLYALGMFRTLGGSQELPNTHEEVRQLLAHWKRDQAALHQRFDANGDGVLDVREWEQVRQEARREVLREQRTRAGQPAQHLLTRPEDGRPYLLSVLPQHQLVGRLRAYAVAAVLVFLLGGAAATWFISVRLAY